MHAAPQVLIPARPLHKLLLEEGEALAYPPEQQE